MPLNDAQKAQLESEVQRARLAKQAHESYIKAHVDNTVKNIYDAFESCAIDDIETLKTLKGLLSAVRGLERSVLNDIDTGRMAEIALENEK